MAELTLEDWRRMVDGKLPALFGIEPIAIEHGHVVLRLEIRPEFLAPNGYLHAGTVVTLADTACGLGSGVSLPEGATGFTTIELKANFLRTAREGNGLRCEGRLVHGGRTTQVWDATVTREDDGKELALFRATQYMLQRE